MNVTLLDVLARLDSVLSWTYLDRPQETPIIGVAVTPKKIKKHFLYICFPEKESDHDLVKEAVHHGAVAIIADRPIDARVPVIFCRDVKIANRQLATLFPAAGITGDDSNKNDSEPKEEESV